MMNSWRIHYQCLNEDPMLSLVGQLDTMIEMQLILEEIKYSIRGAIAVG